MVNWHVSLTRSVPYCNIVDEREKQNGRACKYSLD